MPRDLISVLQRFREGRAGHQRALDRGDVAAGGCRGIEQDLEEIRRAAIADRAIGLDQLELRSVLPGPAGITAQPSARAEASKMKPPGVR